MIVSFLFPPSLEGKFMKSVGEEYKVVRGEESIMAAGKNIK